MTFPTLRPTRRSFGAGDFPVKTYTANNGKQLRILYGSRRTNRTIELTYENITDAQGYDFFEDYDESFGTFSEVELTEDMIDAIFAGWSQQDRLAIIGGRAIQWRYAEAPQIVSVKPGRCTVTVKLVGVV